MKMLNFKIQAACTVSVVSILVLAMGAEIPQCKMVNMEMTEETSMNLTECLQEVKAVTFKEIPDDKKSCFGKCILMKKNLVDERGMVHKENIMQLVQDNLPKPVADDLIKKLEQCFTDNGSNLQTSEETCDSFSPLMECMHMSFMDVCRSEES